MCFRPAAFVLVALLLGLGLAACSGSDDGEETGTESAAVEEAQSPDSNAPGAVERAERADGGGEEDGQGEEGDGAGSDDAALSAEETPTDPEEIARALPGSQVTGEGRVQTLEPSPQRHQKAQENMYGSIREFGGETEGEEATQITYALLDYLTAIARGRWQRACARLYSPLVEGMEEQGEVVAPQARGSGCPQILRVMMRRVPAAERRRDAQIDVSSVRRGDGDDRAFVIYKTPNVLSADMPLYLEDGIWKVAALEAYTLTPDQVG